MYKISTYIFGVPEGYLRKILLIMRLTTILLLATLLQVSAKTYSQTVTLDLKNASLSELLKEIRVQTGYDFLYNRDMLKDTKPVTIQVKNGFLTDVLDKCLEGQPLTYKIEDMAVLLEERKKPSLFERIKDAFNAIDVSGVVVDENGKPMPGVTVKLKDNRQATTTNLNGHFNLSSVKENVIVVFNYIGYKTYEVKAMNDMGLIKMEPSQSELDEVAITAYGTTNKRISTTDISVIKAKDIENKPVGNVLLAIQGQVPGVNIVQQTGMPGSAINVQIRGRNSIANSNAPFYVVDGVPYFGKVLTTDDFSVLRGSSVGVGAADVQYGNPLDFISPMDIESITILKDADATAIYGSKAANGAILITTKKGKSGPTKLSVDVMTGWGAPKHMKLLNTEQYLEMRRSAYIYDGLPVPNLSTSNKDFSNYDLTLYDPNRYTDWQSELLGNNLFTRENLSVSGGNSNTQFLVGFNYNTQRVMKNFSQVVPASLKQGALHFSINSNSANQRFTIGLQGSYSDNRNAPALADLTKYALRLAPNAPDLFDADGNLNWAPYNGISTWNNSLSTLYAKRKLNNTLLTGSLNLSFKFSNDFLISTRVGYNRNQIYQFLGTTYAAQMPENRDFFSPRGNFSSGYQSSWIIEPQLTYKHNWNKHRVEGLIGATYQAQDTYQQTIIARGFATDLETENPAAASSLSYQGTNFAQVRYNAGFLQLNYNYDDRYVLNLNGRRDGSSRFGANNRFHDFWSAGTAWIFSNESWLKNNKVLSFGKLRTSYGTTGSDQIGDYRFLNLYNAQNLAYTYQDSRSYLSSGKLPNPNLQWEETSKWQWGLDLGLFSDRIQVTGNYYVNKTTNQLVVYNLPSISGNTYVEANIPIAIRNNGWEFSISSINIATKSFRWTSGFNISLPRTVLLSYPGLELSSNRDIWSIGQPINRIRLLDYAGIDPATGLFSYWNAEGKRTSNPDFSKDAKIFKSVDSPCQGALSSSFSYKSLKLDILFSFVIQEGPNYSVVGFLAGAPGEFVSDSYIGNQPAIILEDGNHQKFTTMAYAHPELATALSSVFSSTFGYGRADYARLKNLSLSWSIPKKWLNKIGLQNGSFYGTAQNLLTITNYKGLDPENLSVEALPPLRMTTIGIRAGF